MHIYDAQYFALVAIIFSKFFECIRRAGFVTSFQMSFPIGPASQVLKSFQNSGRNVVQPDYPIFSKARLNCFRLIVEMYIFVDGFLPTSADKTILSPP